MVYEHQADGQSDDTDDHTQCQRWPRPARLPEGLEAIVSFTSHGPVVPRRLKTLPGEREDKKPGRAKEEPHFGVALFVPRAFFSGETQRGSLSFAN